RLRLACHEPAGELARDRGGKVDRGRECLAPRGLECLLHLRHAAGKAVGGGREPARARALGFGKALGKALGAGVARNCLQSGVLGRAGAGRVAQVEVEGEACGSGAHQITISSSDLPLAMMISPRAARSLALATMRAWAS